MPDKDSLRKEKHSSLVNIKTKNRIFTIYSSNTSKKIEHHDRVEFIMTYKTYLTHASKSVWFVTPVEHKREKEKDQLIEKSIWQSPPSFLNKTSKFLRHRKTIIQHKKTLYANSAAHTITNEEKQKAFALQSRLRPASQLLPFHSVLF